MTKNEEDKIMQEFLTNAPRLRNCEIVQYDDFAPQLNKEFIQEVINSHDCIEHYAFVHHDKDLKEDGQPKAAHWHIFLHFNEAQSFEHVASWFGVGVNYCNKFKSKKWQVAFAYAVHFFDNKKYQYPVEEVTSDLDYTAMLEELDCDRKIPDKIDFEQNTILFYRKKYMYNAKKLREVIELYNNYLVVKAKERKDRNMQVVYITGPAGIGKTTVAKVIASYKYPNEEIFISSSSNDILDGYQGEKCIILDDLRDDAMKYADLLKFLDNNTNSSVKSRYSNKQLVRCELVIITSVKSPDELYLGVNESKTQLYRRIREYMAVAGSIDKELIITDFIFDPKFGKFKQLHKINVTQMVHQFLDKNKESIIQSFSDTLVKEGLATAVDDKLPF